MVVTTPLLYIDRNGYNAVDSECENELYIGHISQIEPIQEENRTIQKYTYMQAPTSLFAGLLLDGLVLVYPPGDALLVSVLQPEVVGLQDVEMGEDVRQQLVTQRGALQQTINMTPGFL